MPTLSACIISKNEEKTIGTLLASLKNVADEIILVDTGSTDSTIEIAKKYGSKIYELPWDNDFSKARNYAVDKATKEWILYIDCDEYLAEGSKHVLKQNLSNKFEAYTISLINIVNGNETLESQSLRLFKNRPSYRFKGRIHEQIAPSILAKYPEKFIQYMPLKLYHTGYNPEVVKSKNKNQRNFDIFNSYKEEEKDGFFYYNLAGEYSRAGDTLNACENYKKAYVTPAFENGFREYLSIYLVKTLIDQQKYAEAIYYCNETLKKHPDFPDIHFLAASCYSTIFKNSFAYTGIINYKHFKKLCGLNYPDFKLEESNELDVILNNLKNISYFLKEYKIAIIVDAREFLHPKFLETISDITDEIHVVLSGKNSIHAENIENFLCKTIVSSNYSEAEENIINSTEKPYILKLNGNEFIQRDWVGKLLEFVDGNSSSINGSILDKNYNFKSELRLINKNSKNVEPSKNFLIYTN